jgi:hypothetical protein
MVNEQMAMPAEMAAQGPNPDEMAIYEQMRQQISPQEFSNEMLAGASQMDPQAVAEFTQELQEADISPEELEQLNNVVDEILANPAQYEQIRQRYVDQGLEEDLLPEQFDAPFFAALNMAVDQLIAAPAGVQAFAKGGIAELKPIAKAIASYGRNGDTMLAHITPAEARMLKRRGGSGTINPDTGLPEFFLKKAFRKIKSAVKKFASSTVGKLVTTVALGFFLGPAAASFLGATSAAGVAAVSGFVGSAGSTLLGGGNLRDALKAGAIGGLTAGAGAAVAGGAGAFQAGSYTGPTTIGGQVDKFKDMIGMAPTTTPPAMAPVVDAPAAVPGTGVQTSPIPESINTSQTGTNLFDQPAGAPAALDATAAPGSLAKLPPPPPPPPSGSMFDTAKDFYSKNISPSGIREAGTQAAMDKTLAQFPGATSAQVMNAPASSVLGKAYQAALPGTLATYAPAAAAGLGIMALGGGFETKEPTLSPEARALLDRDKDRVKIGDRPDQFYIQNLPGVKYDEKGAIIGSTPYTPTPTSLDDIRVPARSLTPSPSAGMGMPSIQPPVYSSGQGTMGLAPQVTQPFNTSSMYADLMAPPRRLANGGGVGYPMAGIASLAKGGYPRRTGQISGPGTEKSDSIPAMLSDGEFVMTAGAVRGADPTGKGNRRAGAKQMYKLMHQLERNASRG